MVEENFMAGTLKLRDYGSFIDSLKRGEFIAIADVDQDERTISAAQALKNRSAGAFVNVPVIEQGRLVAVLFLNNAKSASMGARGSCVRSRNRRTDEDGDGTIEGGGSASPCERDPRS